VFNRAKYPQNMPKNNFNFVLRMSSVRKYYTQSEKIIYCLKVCNFTAQRALENGCDTALHRLSNDYNLVENKRSNIILGQIKEQ
jgi:hypothetical protein